MQQNNNNRPCRWAFLGLSGIAVKFLKDLANADLQHELVAVGTTGSEQRARTWLAEHHRRPQAADTQQQQVAVYTSYTELLQHGDFDIVYISTPPALHFSNARDALLAGRNVLLEKPAVLTTAQWAWLCGAAKREGVVLMEAMWTRYQPAARAFADTIRPQLGTVRRVLADFSLPVLTDPYLAPDSRWFDWRAGTGALMELGIYPLTWVDLALNGGGGSDANADADADGNANTDPDGNPATSPSKPTPLRVVHAHTLPFPGPSGPIDDLTTVVLHRTHPACTIVLTVSLSVPGSAVPPHDARLVVPKNAPSVRIQGTHAEAAIGFPPIRAEAIGVLHYGGARVGVDGGELGEEVRRPLRGWGLWCQADVIARTVLEGGGRREKGEGVVVGEEETGRVLGWLEEARGMAGIKFAAEVEGVEGR